MSFYRKYRPQKLAEIVGQAHVRQTFANALSRGGLSHAYLFTGSRGTGKTSTARIIARALNCLNPGADGEPCNECDICRDALLGRLVDLIEIDAASNRGIDEIRDLKEKIQFTPSRAKFKIYVIDEVHMLTKDAFNALLKTLEEPPAHAYFILATTEPHKIPETIISRTQRFDFHRLTEAEITEHLATIAQKEGIAFEPAALGLIARQSAGGMRDALGMLEQLGAGGAVSVESVSQNLGLSRPQAVEDFVFALLFSKLTEALATIDGLVAEGANLIQFNKTVLAKLREVMLQKVAENKLPEAKKTLAIIDEFTRAGEELKNAVIPQLPLEVAAISVCAAHVAIPSASKIEPKTEVAPKVEIKKAPDQTEKKFAAVVTEVAAQKIDTGAAISIPLVEAALPQILSKIQNPTVKMVLKGAKILAADGVTLELGVGSDFLVGKLDAAARNLLAEKFAEVLGRNLQIKIVRAEIQIASAAPEISEKPQTKPRTIADAAENLFEEGW
ncbi:MAG: DNA polymerase III subunit gamma/tau [Patescibacteria group bacterium]|jgi:DNA polymerase-3 subunit gamma/tau